mmetsp:Transcript_39728/g.98324  ORF Transcript_39728/g.98324 Transcript_39728/m.98324 type:complete len:150 (+) Transcript_39728:40-489(+)|eukprot:CAMPEP_0197584740 /NCGR_PEP_ID=MMETSP1326-20131121/7258_1 /TAXON_ID=1155430 /ORGANISM="Genus nov. species nov., Strain RCC2288" /LENGTH=149 /DNA_ID=CAMNT_0043149151 /DNA_START=47 /DNA_END=496 /DNA_ORIENTATION=+
MSSKNAPRTVKDVPAQEFVVALAQYFRSTGKMEVPTWVDIVKTAAYKELAPSDPDWFYIRAASMARKLYVNGNLGVGGFRKGYCGANNRGTRRFHHAIGSGSVARAILKQLESVGVVEKDPKSGRRITPSGQRDLDRIAGRVAVPVMEQ